MELGPEQEVGDASWDEIDAALTRLDGSTYNEVSLERAPDQDGSQETMIVGGGADGRLTVAYTWLGPDQSRHWWFLSDPSRGDAVETRTVGGQETPLPGRLWVSRSEAAAASSHFLLHGGRNPDLIWVVDIVD